MKKMILIVALLCLQAAAYAQFTPSVYVGAGLFTNLGGPIGLGTEMRYGNVSASLAGSYVPYDFSPPFRYVGDNPYFGYDVGVKYYAYKGLFAGVNYGLVGKQFHGVKIDDEQVLEVKDVYAFTFSAGYKIPFGKGFYGTPYIGTTTNWAANHLMGLFYPNVGFLFGYDIKH